MMRPEILSREAGVFAETADRLGVSFTTTELFHGSVADCLAMLGRHAGDARAGVYIETVDGAFRLDPPDIETVLRERSSP